ncbi:MAG: hypothetical protein H7A23_06965 [Leptospiraceae bacterium]|nr:hypothetical protein [Leptospiraceae bacterium]MCP5494279.1 hypothetical protein [Leptospiraceae bacterium]
MKKSFLKNISLLLLFLFPIIFLDCKFKKKLPKLFAIFPSENSSKKIILENSTGLFTNEYGRTASFTIKLSAPPSNGVTIGPISSLDTTEGTVISDSTITFTAENYDSPQTITVQGIGDGIPDGNQEYRINFGSVNTSDYNYSLITIPEVSVINTDKETASISASPTLGLSTNESGTTATFNVVLSTQPGADVVISGFSSDTPSECSVSGSLTFTSSNWDTPQAVTVTGVDDMFIDGSKNCIITSSASTSEDQVYVNKTIPPVTVVNVDNDTAGFTFIPITTAITTEGGGQAQFSIVMNTNPYGNISISGITTSDATEGTISPANITFTPSDWNTPQVLTLTGVDDSMADGDVNYTVVFPNSTAVNPSDSSYNGLTLSSAGSFTNQDNDTKGFDITPASLSVTEGGASQVFQMRLTSIPYTAPHVAGSFTITFTNNNPSRYTVSPASLTFDSSNWNIYQNVTVTATDNSIDDGDLNTTLVLPVVGTTDYNGMDPADIAITVTDNDTAGFTISPAGGVSVNENDVVGGPGLEATITVVLNSEPTGNVTLGPVISTDTLEITVAPTIGGGNTPITNRTLVFTPTAGQAIVNSDSNSDAINDTSTGGWNVPQTIRVRAVVDGSFDGNQTRAIRFSSRSTTDTLYASAVATPTPDVPATNVDSGTPQIILQSISSTNLSEGGSTITFQVVLATLPTSTVTISNIVSSDTTEGVVLPNGGGAAITNRTLVFNATTNLAPTGTNTTTGGWNMPQTVTIQSVDDSFDDGDITFIVTIPSATGATEYNGLFPQSANGSYNQANGQLTLINVDNDARGFTISPTSVTVTEGGGNQTFNVKLNSDPCSTPGIPANCTSAPITLNLTNNNTSQYTISPSSLTFTAGSWNTNQTITVTAVNDDFDENNMSFTLLLNAISGSSTDYDGLDPSDVTVTVADNDTIGISLALATGYSDVTSNSGGFTEYNLSLTSRPAIGNTVTVIASVPIASPQEGKILDTNNVTQLNSRVFTFTDTDWSTVQTFRVKGLTGDTNPATTSATFMLTLTATEAGTLPPAGYTALTYNNYNSATATKTITNYHVGTGKKIRLAGTITTIAENAGTAPFWIFLNQAPTNPVTINFGIDSAASCTLPATVGSSPQFTVNPAFIILDSSNWDQITTTNTVTVTGYNDAVDDGDISCLLKVTSVTSSDPYYTGLTSSDYNEPSITTTDDDAVSITRSNQSPLISGKLITSSSGASATLQYKLASKPMDNVTLTFSVSPNLATLSTATMTFTPSNYSTAQTLTVTGVSGSVTDDNYTITATATTTEISTGAANSGIYNALTSTQNATNRYLLYDLVPCTGPAVGTCSAVNGTGGTVAGTYTTTEAGGKSYFAIALRAKPNSNVIIPISSSDTTEGTVSPANLTFTSGNWNTLQVVTVTGVDDLVTDGDIVYSIDFGAMTGDANFTTTIPSLSVTNIDND